MRIEQAGTGQPCYDNRAVAERLLAELQAGGFSQPDLCGHNALPISWETVESKLFSAAAYSACERRLYLRFHSGDIYCYFGFPAEQYHQFLAAGSKGSYFAHNIRNRFRYSRIHLAG